MFGVPMSIALFISSALFIAGLDLTPPWPFIHHCVIIATEPAVCGAAIEVPEQTEWMVEPGGVGLEHVPPVGLRVETTFSPGVVM
jgi:hypothetical protein